MPYSVLRNDTFCVAKGCLLHCKKPSFALQKATYHACKSMPFGHHRIIHHAVFLIKIVVSLLPVLRYIQVYAGMLSLSAEYCYDEKLPAYILSSLVHQYRCRAIQCL